MSDSPPTVAQTERALIGLLLVCPEFAARTAVLRPEDFTSESRAAAFRLLRERAPKTDVLTVALAMEREGLQPPDALGWGEALCACMDEFTRTWTVDGDAAERWSRELRAMAIERRMKKGATKR